MTVDQVLPLCEIACRNKPASLCVADKVSVLKEKYLLPDRRAFGPRLCPFLLLMVKATQYLKAQTFPCVRVNCQNSDKSTVAYVELTGITNLLSFLIQEYRHILQIDVSAGFNKNTSVQYVIISLSYVKR